MIRSIRKTQSLAKPGDGYIVPVTYMNSSADLKDFVGRHGGVVCTSSNAEGVLNWAFERAGREWRGTVFPRPTPWQKYRSKDGNPKVENACLGSEYGVNGRRYKQS